MDAPRHTKAGDPAGIAREAELLGLARHPGLVGLIGIEGDPRHPVLVTRQIEGSPLSELSLCRAEAAGVIAAVASTLSDLHQLGIVHGAVAPDHVIVESGGRPVLCGLAHGGRVGESSPGPPSVPERFADPAHREGHPLDPSVDVFALGALLAAQLADSSRPGDTLLRLAEDATDPDPAQRPTASKLATAIKAAVPDARLPGAPPGAGTRTGLGDGTSVGPGADVGERSWPGPPPRLPGPQPVPRSAPVDLDALRRSHRARLTPERRLQVRRRAGGGWQRRIVVPTLGTLVVGVVAVLVFIEGLSGSRQNTAVQGEETPTQTAFAPQAALAPSTVPSPSLVPSPVPTTTDAVVITAVPSPQDCPPVGPSLGADTDGDGCVEELRYAAGILESGSARWSVGDDGDQVATGDWTCRGKSDLALLHPATGDVFVFDGWAPAEHDLVVAAAARVEGGFALRAAKLGGPGCQRLMVDRRDGPPVAVPTRPGG